MADEDDLYGAPLEQFVPERAALAKSLRSAGRRDEAQRVAKLAKPSVAAWAVNQLIRTQPRAVAALFEAGDALITAQSDVLEGRGDARALREAGQRERAAVDELSAAARGLLGSSGNEMSQTTLDRVSETLHAAALDEQARAQVRDGCLVRELRHVGLGGGSLVAAGPVAAPAPAGPVAAVPAPAVPGPAVPAPAVPAPAVPAPAARGARAGGHATKQGAAPAEPAEPAGKRSDDDSKARAAARAAEKAAEKAKAAARREAERAERDVSAAEERRDRAAEALRAAEEVLAEARRKADEARRAHAAARQRVQ